jgi:hypothetical protein
LHKPAEDISDHVMKGNSVIRVAALARVDKSPGFSDAVAIDKHNGSVM